MMIGQFPLPGSGPQIPGGGGGGFPSLDILLTTLRDIVVAVANLNKTLSTIFPSQTTGTSTSATGGTASALPAQPVGYVTIMVNGQARKVPYYG